VTAGREPIVIGERGYFFVTGELIETDGFTQMRHQSYVQYEFPVEVTKPYPVVMIHGGAGQGIDYFTTPDGRDGWATDFLRAGYRVYVVDRQGCGRSGYDPDLIGPMAKPLFGLEGYQSLFAGNGPRNNAFTHLHTQWPGTGSREDEALLRFLASQGRFIGDWAVAHRLMRLSAEELLTKIGPAVLITNSAGGAWGWQAADVVPELVKGILCVEGAFPWNLPLQPPPKTAQTFAMTAHPMTFDPPVDDLTDISLELVDPAHVGSDPYVMQAEPARRLANLAGVPVGYVTGEGSFLRPQTEGVIRNLQQLGVDVDDLALWEFGIHGNGHVPMCERNSADIARFLIDWIERRVEMPLSANQNNG
jgi:pimeloyl-ACP methyl ester carboxylesterase